MEMMTKITKIIENFAKTGQPAIENEAVEWEVVTKDFNCLTITEKGCVMEILPEKETLDSWNSIYEDEGVRYY